MAGEGGCGLDRHVRGGAGERRLLRLGRGDEDIDGVNLYKGGVSEADGTANAGGDGVEGCDAILGHTDAVGRGDNVSDNGGGMGRITNGGFTLNNN